MMETLGLVDTLEWNIVDKIFLGIENFDRPGKISKVPNTFLKFWS